MKHGSIGKTGEHKLTDWKEIKCTQCKSFKWCRRQNIKKGSEPCQTSLKLIPKRKRDGMSKKATSNAMLWGLFQKSKGTKDELQSEQKDM